MNAYDVVVNEAKKRLKNASRDVAHDLKHHERVWKQCQQIIKNENVSLDANLLRISAYWHDVVVGEEKWPSISMVKETCGHLQTVMDENKLSPIESKIVIDAILYHEFRSSPNSVEGLVLQDADKLDALSEERWSQTLRDYRDGNMTKERLTSYASTFLKWIPIIVATFHYPYSRKAASERIASFWKDTQWKEVISELGLETEYLDSKKSMGKFKSQFLRFALLIKNMLLMLKIRVFTTLF